MVADCFSCPGGVADDHHFLGVRVQLECGLKGFVHGYALAYAGDQLVVYGLGIKIVHSAKYYRHSLEQGFLVFHGELKGLVVHGHDQVEIVVGILVVEKIVKSLVIRF